MLYHVQHQFSIIFKFRRTCVFKNIPDTNYKRTVVDHKIDNIAVPSNKLNKLIPVFKNVLNTFNYKLIIVKHKIDNIFKRAKQIYLCV